MRKKITPAEAVAIGGRIKAARARLNKSLQEVGSAAGVHHSQVSRCERGGFKVISKNVQKLCETLEVAHPKLADMTPVGRPLQERLGALLERLPGSATAFARLFDVLEASALTPAARKRTGRRPA